MNFIFFEAINLYTNLKNEILSQYFQLFKQNEMNLFFERWFRLHVELFKKLNEEKFESFSEDNKLFIKKRLYMISSFIQYLKINKFENIAKFKEIIKFHDEYFKNILSKILKQYSSELIKIQRFRKVTAAYVHSLEG